MKRFKVFYNPTLNNNEGGYPTVSNDVPIEYVGWVNPLVFNITMKPNDIWTFHTRLPFVNEIEITKADEFNVQNIIDSAPNYTRIIFKSNGGNPTIYKTANLKPNNGKIIHLFGEKDSLGNNLITIDTSLQLTSWTVSGGLWVTTLSSNPNSVEQPPNYTAVWDGYYYDLPFHLEVDGIPFDPVASTTEVTNNPGEKFYYNNTTKELYIGINPTGKTILWARDFTFFSSGGIIPHSSNAADNCIVEGFNITRLGGSNQSGSAVGGPLGRWDASKNHRPMLRWVYKDLNVFLCRSGSLRNKFGSHTVNCRVTNCGVGVVTAGQISQTSWDNGFNQSAINVNEISTINYFGSYCGWSHAEGSLARKLNRVWQTLHLDCVSFRQGYCSYKTLLSSVCGEWFDNCYYATLKRCKYIEAYSNGIFVEISHYVKVEDCEIIECDNSMTSLDNGGGIYNSSSNYTEYRRNLFICRSTNVGTRVRPIHIHQDDRGTGYLGEWRSKFVTFENNIIRYLGTNGRLQVNSARADSPNPSYKAYVSGEVIIRNNTYYGATGNRYHVGGTGTINFSTFSSLTDNNNVPFNWEQGSVLL